MQSAEFLKKNGHPLIFSLKRMGNLCALFCSQHVSVLKEYNLRHHYETQHANKYDNLKGQERREKVKELLAGLKKQQSVFTHSQEISDAAVKASYLIGNEIA